MYRRTEDCGLSRLKHGILELGTAVPRAIAYVLPHGAVIGVERLACPGELTVKREASRHARIREANEPVGAAMRGHADDASTWG